MINLLGSKLRAMSSEYSRPDDQLPSALIDNVAGIDISTDGNYERRFFDVTNDDFSSDGYDDDSGPDDISICERDATPDLGKGTITLAFTFKQGVIVAVNHHSSESVENVINLSSSILLAFAGEMEDCRSFLRDLQCKYQEHEISKGGIVSVEEASEWVADYLCSSSSEKGPRLYEVDGEGKLFVGGLIAIGYGSVFAECACETRGFRNNKSDEDAIKFAKETIRYALSMVKRYYDNGQNGGFISGFYVGADGCKMVIDKEDVGEVVTKDADIEEDVGEEMQESF
ncbi:OLC1v1002429C1 [Oldenlandia corymbosa var. corymbosa]|uniref:OLC1v1002429C1 n=1 Tax=Oldenlandia corymbosa var. corymbosa TaxID=529605 RepID=A0AAV1D7M1_OLDCO|nr:OLC1v1002429C1 [Oldenlandia corymbosa var. corymbosa]